MPFYFRINKLKIIDNRERRSFLGIIGPDEAEVKLVSFVTTDNQQLPVLDELFRTTDEGRRLELLRSAVQIIAGSRVFTEIHHVKDNHKMTFGPTGFNLYRSEDIPESLDWTFLAIESDTDVREMGEAIDGVIKDERFGTLATTLLGSAGVAAGPAGAAVIITRFIVDAVSRNMANNKDDQIGLVYLSLNRKQHYSHGEYKRDDVIDLTNNMLVDFSLFGFEEA